MSAARRLQGAVSQKDILILAAVRTSNLIEV
jgi:hypothetical protein